MKLFLISQDINKGYDTFDSAVVSAESADDARTIHPIGSYEFTPLKWGQDGRCWVPYHEAHKIKVEYIGETEKERGVICASFNAG